VRPLAAYFSEVEAAASMLQAMAEAERAGQPFTAAQMAFINQAIDEVRMSVGSGSALQPRGWYPRLFLQADEATKVSPTIADVHSNPDPEAPGVLHVATGFARLMVVTADTCNGPRAYAGLVSSYFEHIPSGYQRLDDQQWATRLNQGPPLPDESWVEGLIAR
jgi:hypothetical protein